MPQSIITSKGQITIPKSVRTKLNLKTGDKVDFKISDGTVTLVPVSNNVTDVFGLLSRESQKTVTVEQMNDALKKAIRSGNK